MARRDGGRRVSLRVVRLSRGPAVWGKEGNRQKEGPRRGRGCGDQLVRPAGEEVGGVELRLVGRPVAAQRPVLVDRVAVVAIRRGIDRAVPVVPPGRHLRWRREPPVPVEELAHLHRAIAGGLKPERQPVRLVEARVSARRRTVSQHTVVVRVLPGVERGPRRAAERVTHKTARERDALVAQQLLGLGHDPHRCQRLVVGLEDHDVALGVRRRGEQEKEHEANDDRDAHARVNSGARPEVRRAGGNSRAEPPWPLPRPRAPLRTAPFVRQPRGQARASTGWLLTLAPRSPTARGTSRLTPAPVGDRGADSVRCQQLDRQPRQEGHRVRGRAVEIEDHRGGARERVSWLGKPP